MDRHKPFAEGQLGILEDTAHSDRELLSARLALVDARANGALTPRLGRQLVDFIGPAMRAHGAVGPSFALDKLPRLVFVCEQRQ